MPVFLFGQVTICSGDCSAEPEGIEFGLNSFALRGLDSWQFVGASSVAIIDSDGFGPGVGCQFAGNATTNLASVNWQTRHRLASGSWSAWISYETSPSSWGQYTFQIEPVNGIATIWEFRRELQYDCITRGRVEYLYSEVLSATCLGSIAMSGTPTDASNCPDSNDGSVLVEIAGISTQSYPTPNELNNQGFEIHRSSDQQPDWQLLDFVKGQGTTAIENSYSYIDPEPRPDSYYYRLKQVDFDGAYEWSNTVTVEIEKATSIQLWPTLARDIITVQYLDSQSNQDVEVIIFNLQGQVVLSGEFQQQYALDISNLSPGAYFAHIKSQHAKSTIKFIKVQL